MGVEKGCVCVCLYVCVCGFVLGQGHVYGSKIVSPITEILIH